ncbi:MAG: thiopurine S-methyltransferase, partial [Verrucomicrobiota bacterium]
ELFSGENINIFVGDVFDLNSEQVGPVNAVYDRAALVALPKEMRRRYTAHLLNMTSRSSQLLVTFEYDQELMPGPPFAIPADEVEEHYGKTHEPTRLESRHVEGGLKGLGAALESIWLLAQRS